MDKDALKQAQLLQRQGDLRQSLSIYQQLLADNPGNADLLHQIGILYAQQQEYGHSLEFLNKALAKAPHSAPIYNSKGNVYLRKGDQAAALTEYQRAVKIDPRYAIAYNNMGRCLYRQEKFIAAQKAYARALELNPQFADAYYNQGVLLLKIGDLEQSHHALERALALNPNNAAAYGQIAQIFLQKADYSEAIDYLQKRLIMQPDHVDSWHYLGMAHFSLNQFSNAAHCFEKILQLTHRHPECYEHLAITYLKLDDKEKALTYFFRQLEIQPTANAYYNIGVLLTDQGRHRDAIEYLRQSVALEPGHLPAHLNLGVLYLKAQQPEAALTHYRQAAAIKPDDPEIQHILMALSQNSIPEKAPAEYLKNLFDQYAGYYDKHLTESLRYRVPQQLHASICELTHAEQPEWVILDLGCGTGLCGKLFKEFSARLIGIDISQEMVNAAKAKNIYDELIVADIEQALTSFHDVDLVLAADVFTYIGALDGIFEKVRRLLKQHGHFAFTVEKTEKIPFELQPSIRYAHSRVYLEELIHRYDFKIWRLDEIILRMQKESQVIGYRVVLG